LVFKEERDIEILENGKVQFPDKSIEDVDTILIATGYKFSFPFLTKSNLIETEFDGKYFGPLYLRQFSINEPDLMFSGCNNRSTYLQALIEREAMVNKFYVEGKVILPSKEEMLRIFEEEVKMKFNNDLRSYWYFIRGSGQDVEVMRQKSTASDEFYFNKEFYDKLDPFYHLIVEHMSRGDILLSKNDEKFKLIFPDYNGDYSECEVKGVKKILF